jgi:hypothetical protein
MVQAAYDDLENCAQIKSKMEESLRKGYETQLLRLLTNKVGCEKQSDINHAARSKRRVPRCGGKCLVSFLLRFSAH